MAKIHLLQQEVAELIAAGEVVERPASIVKELVENAIDASADQITIEIKGGGVRYIRITDNGCGIAREDVKNAFLRHATSKVLTAEDLNGILTFGFRGEALASVAAMCRVEILTRTAEETCGTRYVIEGGVEKDLLDAGCPVGTTLVVRDVFYNTPARMKFLKKDSTEGMGVSNVVDRMALSNPGVSFRYLREGELKLTTPGNGDLLSAIHAVYGKEFSSSLIPLGEGRGLVRAEGYISKPECARGTRSMQHFFVNGRYVHSKTCAAALEEAYKNSTMVGKFPGCVLNLVIPPDTVDVNVHPAKTEVRFSDERAVYNVVYAACKDAVSQYSKDRFLGDPQPAKKPSITPFGLRAFDHTGEQQRFSHLEHSASSAPPPQRGWAPPPKLEPQQKRDWNTGSQSKVIPSKPDTPSRETLLVADDVLVPYRIKGTAAAQKQMEIPPQKSIEADKPPLSGRGGIPPAGENKPAPLLYSGDTDPYEDIRLVGEVFGTYLVLQTPDAIILVDKHAAHERYIFNQLKSQGREMERQVLLSPIPVNLSKEEYAAAVESLDLFEDAGFSAEDFGDGCLLIRETPLLLNQLDIPAVVAEVASKIAAHNREVTPDLIEDLYHSVSCKSAIKAHDKNGALELSQLVRLIRENDDLRYCPHGRPISVRITQKELEKMFGRIV